MRPSQNPTLSASLLDSMLVFALVIAVGSVCSIFILNDIGRYWTGVRQRLEKVGVPAPKPAPKPAPTPSPTP